MGNSCTSAFPNTHAWEQQERNKIKRQTKMVRREARVWKEAKRERTKEDPTAIISYPKYNNYKQNRVIFYKNYKKFNEIQLTKSKTYLNIRKMTHHQPSPDATLYSLSICHNPRRSINPIIRIFQIHKRPKYIFPSR